MYTFKLLGYKTHPVSRVWVIGPAPEMAVRIYFYRPRKKDTKLFFTCFHYVVLKFKHRAAMSDTYVLYNIWR